MTEPPARLCCGQRHYGGICPDGKVMCRLCFERFSQDQLHVNERGEREDVCIRCHEMEQKAA